MTIVVIFTTIVFGMNIFNLTQPSFADDSRVFALLDLEKKGLAYSEFKRVTNQYAFTPLLWAGILGINLRTYQRRLEQKKGLSSAETGALIEVMQVINYGLEVFEDAKKLNRWLSLPNGTLRGQKPEELLTLASGRKLISDIIGRIDYGVYA